ncbi:hypothetical protein LXT21_36605 [Myxococcus sp. K38C18041901]|uniref:hypothetical protein n=1 Tax=Myxococcus guangdongensis TaxID=2906760 RepID=UPI0020A6ED60|nr:hypothetical protein [Myxococcus guangdongensis]MCP3064308.1 hypothetical protein [Myxococcus guangdongensis]
MKSKLMVAVVLGAGTLLTACGGTLEDTPTSEDVMGAQRAGLTASLSCSQDSSRVSCDALVTEGVAPFTYTWTQRIFLEATGRYYTSGPTPGGASRSFTCRTPDESGTIFSSLRVSATVTDATGAVVHTSSGEFSCG